MTTINHNTFNKEDYENRFLSARIIQQARNKGELDYIADDDIIYLFEDVFAQHHGSALRARAEVAMLAFRDYITQQKEKFLENKISNKNTPNISTQQNVDINQQEKNSTLQKIINKKIFAAGFSGQLQRDAENAIMKNTEHILDTGVSLRVMERVVIEALKDFEQTNNIVEEKKKSYISPLVTDSDNVEDYHSKPTVKISPQNNNIVSETPTQPTQKKKLTLTEMMLKKAREDDKERSLVKPQRVSVPNKTTSQSPINPTHPITELKATAINQQQQQKPPKLGAQNVEYLPKNYWDKMAGITDTTTF